MIPLLLNLKDKAVLVVGAGFIATKRVVTLLEEGAVVSCVGLDISDELKKIGSESLTIRQRKYRSSDLKKMDLVVAATNDQALNDQIKKDCKRRSILCSRADCHQDSDVIFPAVIRRGKLTLSVSTQGASPSLTKEIAQSLSKQYDETYAERLDLLSILRREILKEKKPDQQKILKELSKEPLSELRKKVKESDHLLADNNKKTGEINDN